MNRKIFLKSLGAIFVAPVVLSRLPIKRVSETPKQVPETLKPKEKPFIIDTNKLPKNLSVMEIIKLWKETGILLYKI